MSDLIEPPPPAELPADDQPIALPAPEPKTPTSYIVVGAAMSVGVIAMLIIGGEFASFALMGLFAIPFTLLAMFAYGAEPRPGIIQFLAGGYWLGLMALLSLLAALFSIGAIAMPNIGPSASAEAKEQFPTTEQGIRIAVAIVGLVLSGIVSLACFLPVIRRIGARFTGMDPQSFVHATAFATAIAITLIGVVPLLAVGEPPILTVMKMEGGLTLPDADEQIRTTAYSLVWAVPASFIVVGYPFRRNLREAQLRLGLERPTWRQLAFAVVMTGALLLAMPLMGVGIESIWKTMGWQGTDGELIKELFGFTAGAVGAVIASIVAGLGEEIVFRGVLQPRLGIFLPALMFASVHAMQYDFDALIQVLFLGIVFGIIRRKTNTTTSAIIHGGYDLVLLLTTVHN